MNTRTAASGGAEERTRGDQPSASKESARYDDLKPRPPHEGVVWLPIAMFRDRALWGTPIAIAAHMSIACPKSSFRYWRSVDDLAEACDASVSGVRQGIARLKAAGWLHQVTDVIRRKNRTVFVLAWRLPDVPAYLPTMRPPPRNPAQDSARKAQDSAPPPRPPYKDESYRESETLTFTRACEGTGTAETPTPSPDPVPHPRASTGAPPQSDAPSPGRAASGPQGGPQAASDDQVREWLSVLMRPAIGTPKAIRDLALWGLEDAGRLPAEYADKVPPRRPDPKPHPAPAAGPPPSPAPPSRAPTTVELIERLASPCGPEAIAEAVNKLTDEWDDHPYTPFHKRWMTDVVEGRLRVEVPLRLYKQVRLLNRESRVRIFTGGVNEATGAGNKPAAGPSRQSAPAAGSRRISQR